MTTIVTQGDEGLTSLCNRPMQFGSLPLQDCEHPIRGLYNAEFPALAYCATHFSWAIYGFNSGHFVSTILKWNLPFCVFLACDPYEYSRALVSEFVHEPNSSTQCSIPPQPYPWFGWARAHWWVFDSFTLLSNKSNHICILGYSSINRAPSSVNTKIEPVYRFCSSQPWWPQHFQICIPIEIFWMGYIHFEMLVSQLRRFYYWNCVWASMTAPSLRLSQYCFGFHHRPGHFYWQLSFGNHSINASTPSLFWWMTNPLLPMLAMVSLLHYLCHQCRHLSRPNWNHCIIFMPGIWILHPSLA